MAATSQLTQTGTALRPSVPRLACASAADLRGLVLVIAGGTGLAWLCATYPSRLPFWAPWDFSWPEYLATALGLWCYGRGLARTPPQGRPAWHRRASFVAGVLVTYAVLQTRFDYLAQHMFALTRVQHLATHHLGPFLIALAWPGATILRGMPAPLRRLVEVRLLAKITAALQQPVIAGVLFVGLIFLWLIPPIQFHAMIDRRLYAVMNFSMVADGLLFWCLVLDPRPRRETRNAPGGRLSRGGRLLLAFAVQWPQIAGGAVIGFAEHTLYPYYTLCGRLFPSVSEQTDQQIGGSVIWFGGGMMSAVAALILLHALWAEEERQVIIEHDTVTRRSGRVSCTIAPCHRPGAGAEG